MEIDGSVVGKSPWTGAVDPGAHALIVTKEGYEPLHMSFTMAAGADIGLPAPLRKLEVAAPQPAPPATAPKPATAPPPVTTTAPTPASKPAPAPTPASKPAPASATKPTSKPAAAPAPKAAVIQTNEAQSVDFVTAQNGEQFGVEARGAEGIAHCASSVEVGASCRLALAAGPAHVVISRGMQLTRDLVVPLIAGVVLAGGGVGSFFYFKHRADTSTPVQKVSAWQYAVSGGGVAAGLGLILYGILPPDSLVLKPLTESAPLRVGLAPVQGGVAAAATALF